MSLNVFVHRLPCLPLLEQVVDLSNNALTAVLPMVIIALERPHLEADLAGNQWQCNVSMAVFQNLMSESWRRQWGVICNKSVGTWVVPLLSKRVPAELEKKLKTRRI